MITVSNTLQSAIDNGHTLFPLIVSVKEEANNDGTYDYEAFNGFDIWQGNFSVNRYTSNNGSFPEWGTAIAAECEFFLNVSASYVDWFKDGYSLHLFVYSTDAETRVDEIYNHEDATAALSIPSTLTTDDWILYLGKDGETDGNGHVWHYGHFIRYQGEASGGGHIYDDYNLLCPLGVFYTDSITFYRNSTKIRGLDTLVKLDKSARKLIATATGAGINFGNNSTGLKYNVQSRLGITLDISQIPSTFTSYPAFYRTQKYKDAVYDNGLTYWQLLQNIAQLCGCIIAAPQNDYNTVAFLNAYPASPQYDYTVTRSKIFDFRRNAMDMQELSGIIGSVDGTNYYYGNYSPTDETIDGWATDLTSNNVFQGLDNTTFYNDYVQRLGTYMMTTRSMSWYPFEARILQCPNMEIFDMVNIDEIIPAETGATPTASCINKITFNLNAPMTIGVVGKDYK